jgi:copper homeostasis protein
MSVSDALHGPRQKVLVEACVASVADSIAAAEGGARRLELNRALDRDGLTPPPALLDDVLAATTLPVIVMVRPHDRGFVYTEEEVAGMLDSTRELVERGAAGVAVGPLTAAGRVNRTQLRALLAAADGAEVVFHRAFDIVASMFESLELLIDCGVMRVLTSGQAPTALEGIDAIRRLHARAAGRIEILPGAGVGPANAAAIVEQTGCHQLHGTFRDPDRPGGGTDRRTVAGVCAAAEAAWSARTEESR